MTTEDVRTAVRRRSTTRALAAVGGAWGASLLVRPGTVVDAVAPEFPAARRWVVRALGARLVLQHAAVLAAPTRGTVRAAAVVEAVHAASMLAFVRSPRYGRAAALSAGLAALYAAAAPAVAPRA
ncbi:hypothetical protein ACI8AF_04450 [Blastococcus sp. SYSU D00669]